MVDSPDMIPAQYVGTGRSDNGIEAEGLKG
jgi:hypothetical protein